MDAAACGSATPCGGATPCVCGEIRAAKGYATSGWLPFDRYLQIILHHPRVGYYGGGNVRFGDGGDFYTAPVMSPLFGEVVAGQAAQVLEKCGGGLLELGGGDGHLAEQILSALPPSVPYAILETSAPLRARQQQRLRRFGGRVVWLDALPDSHCGVILANEVLDCLPFRLFIKRQESWQERGVGESNGTLIWQERPPTDSVWQRLADLPLVAAPLADGYQTEISPQAEALTATLTHLLSRGCLLFFDYGFGRAEYYHPQRAGGTMMCHRKQRADADPLADAGDKDVTAHVDFSAIATAATDAGGRLDGYATLANFLINGGILDLLKRHIGDDLLYARHAAAANKLLAPQEMGELFKCIAFSKGDAPPLSAFSSGDVRHRL